MDTQIQKLLDHYNTLYPDTDSDIFSRPQCSDTASDIFSRPQYSDTASDVGSQLEDFDFTDPTGTLVSLLSTAESCKPNNQNLAARFKCHLCSSEFYFRSSLNIHLSAHPNERLHVCVFCLKHFDKRKRLLRHVKRCRKFCYESVIGETFCQAEGATGNPDQKHKQLGEDKIPLEPIPDLYQPPAYSASDCFPIPPSNLFNYSPVSKEPLQRRSLNGSGHNGFSGSNYRISDSSNSSKASVYGGLKHRLDRWILSRKSALSELETISIDDISPGSLSDSNLKGCIDTTLSQTTTLSQATTKKIQNSSEACDRHLSSPFSFIDFALDDAKRASKTTVFTKCQMNETPFLPKIEHRQKTKNCQTVQKQVKSILQPQTKSTSRKLAENLQVNGCQKDRKAANAMTEIREQVITGLSTISAVQRYFPSSQPSSDGSVEDELIYEVQIRIDWNLQAYMIDQYGSSRPSIGSMVVLAGSANCAQAIIYSKYLKNTWPKSGSKFLNALQAAIGEVYDESTTVQTNDLHNNVIFMLSLKHPGRDTCFVCGTKEFLVEVTQMLAFTGTAFRTSPYNKELAYCRAEIEVKGKTSSWFQMRFRSEQIPPNEQSCWLTMFHGASIAHGFPVAERGDELGLEVPLQMVAAITGVRHAVEYDGCIAMKGFSSMFVPVKKNEDRVQWHLITSNDCEIRLSYSEALEQCPRRANLEDVNLENLHTTRAIIGWCIEARSALGSGKAEYDNIQFSTVEQSTKGVKVKGGSFGFQQFGFAQFDFSLGAKDGKCHFQRTGGPYKRIISAAEKTPIVLYDASEKRAWLVPATEVMLHMIHHRHRLEPFEVNERPIELPTTDGSGATAKEVLLKNADMDLSDAGTHTLKDTVTGIWSLLEFLIDQRVHQDQEPGTRPRLTMQESLHGFEFKAVVQERSPFRPKQTTILKSSGGWPALVRDIDALVLFASGLGDVIHPVRNNVANQGLCQSWSVVPKDKDYLCASVNMLIDLYDLAGHKLDRTYLTSTRLQWHRGSSALFESCPTPGSICRCSRLQQVLAKRTFGHIEKPGPLAENGAVIFGQSKSLLYLMDSTVSDTRARSSFYGQPNTPSEFSPPPLDASSMASSSSTRSECYDINRSRTQETERTRTASLASCIIEDTGTSTEYVHKIEEYHSDKDNLERLPTHENYNRPTRR